MGLAVSPQRARSICATSAAEISCSRSVLQAAINTTIAAAKKPRMASHQICQISEKPMITAKKAMMKPAGLLRGTSIASYAGSTWTGPVRLMCQNASMVSTVGSTAKL